MILLAILLMFIAPKPAEMVTDIRKIWKSNYHTFNVLVSRFECAGIQGIVILALSTGGGSRIGGALGGKHVFRNFTLL